MCKHVIQISLVVCSLFLTPRCLSEQLVFTGDYQVTEKVSLFRPCGNFQSGTYLSGTYHAKPADETVQKQLQIADYRSPRGVIKILGEFSHERVTGYDGEVVILQVLEYGRSISCENT